MLFYSSPLMRFLSGVDTFSQAIDLVHLWEVRGDTALCSQQEIQPSSVYSQRI